MQTRTHTTTPGADDQDITTLQWVVSLLFWCQLLIAAVLYGAVSLSPKLAVHVELRNDYLKTQSQLVYLQQQVTELQKVTDSLTNDPRLLQELVRVELNADRPGEERMPVRRDLALQSRITQKRSHAPDVTRAWYVPLLSAFAGNQRLRHASLLAAASLVLIAFAFFHPSQAKQFNTGWNAIREGTSVVVARYRG